MAKPATLDGYSDQYTVDCERVLVTLLRGLGPWKDSVYLVGGLTPRYLVAARPPMVPAHAGTLDVDIVIDLQILADTLKNCFPPKSCLSRYGGDEMVAAVCNIGLKESLSQVERLLQTIRKLAIPIEVVGRKKDIAITCSIGMLFCESGSKPVCAGRILELADHQMYQVKNKEKNSYSYQILSAQPVAQLSHISMHK